jgi:hypothetical protein
MFSRLERTLFDDNGAEDQQALNRLLDDNHFASVALDPNPLNLEVKTNIQVRESRTDPFVYSFFSQLEVWSGHNRFRDVVCILLIIAIPRLE